LGVIGAVAEAEKGGRQKLQAAKPLIYFLRALTANDPAGDSGEKNRQKHTYDGRQENKDNGLNPATKDQRFETGVSDSSAAVAANQGVRRAGRKAEDQGDEIPSDGAEESGQQHLLGDMFNVDHAFADGAGDGGAEDERGDKVPEGGPGDCAEGCEDARRDYRSDGIGGIVPAI
jgi:hypothetical protein